MVTGGGDEQSADRDSTGSESADRASPGSDGGTESPESEASDRASADSESPAQGPAGIVAFDNSGTLSQNLAVETALSEDVAWATPVPDAPVERGRVALVSFDHDGLAPLRTERPLGDVLAAEEVPLYLALSNADVTEPEVREALLAAETPASRLHELAERARAEASEAVDGDETPVPGVQAVVDASAGRVLGVIGYVATPRRAASEVVEAVRERGFDVHLVSGDTEPILRRVAAGVGVPAGNVHAYQSPTDKADTVRTLRAATDGPVVMVGDYVNDRIAFEVADLAVFVDDAGDETARSVLGPRADHRIDDIADLPAALDER